MLTKSHLVLAGIAAAALVSDFKNQIDAKKAAKLYLTAMEAYEDEQRANEAQISYLCHMLDEHGIPADEFDLIALNFNQ